MQGTKALLHGIYKVNVVQKIVELPKELISVKDLENWGDVPYYKYEFKRDDALNDLEERLVIDYRTRRFYQWT
jgi:hypothetical protein